MQMNGVNGVNELLQIVTVKGVSLHIKEKIYKACVQSHCLWK